MLVWCSGILLYNITHFICFDLPPTLDITDVLEDGSLLMRRHRKQNKTLHLVIHVNHTPNSIYPFGSFFCRMLCGIPTCAIRNILSCVVSSWFCTKHCLLDGQTCSVHLALSDLERFLTNSHQL